MARTLLNPDNAPGAYPVAGVQLNFQAADATNNNYFVSTGRELLIAQNSDGAAAHTVTIHSQPDNFGRSGDISAESIPANGFHVFGPFAKSYWADSTGNINIDASATTIKFAVVRIP